MSPIAQRTQELTLELAPDPDAPRHARNALRRARVPEDLEHTVVLLVTELIANSVRHAHLESGQRIGVRARFEGDHARVEVSDPGPGFDPAEAAAGKGFGLRMVDKLASDWGVETGDGTRVWFEVDRRSRRRFG